MSSGDDLLTDARQIVSQAAEMLSEFGIRAQALPDCVVGCGFGVVHADDSWTLISAMGASNAVNVTAGVLKNVEHRREFILNECNEATRDSGYPVFLHDADAGWDVLIQARFPAYVMSGIADYFAGLVNGLPQLAAATAKKLQPEVGGSGYGLTGEDTSRLLVRSIM